jgi:hypothetical protein
MMCSKRPLGMGAILTPASPDSLVALTVLPFWHLRRGLAAVFWS